MTELKGYAMMQFSYMLLKTYGKGESIERHQRPNKVLDFRFVYMRPCRDI